MRMEDSCGAEGHRNVAAPARFKHSTKTSQTREQARPVRLAFRKVTAGQVKAKRITLSTTITDVLLT